jgi:hypothetical protein
MAIFVAFDQENSHRDPEAKTIELGPYLVAQLVGNVLHVSQGFQPFILATRDEAGWTVNGLDGLLFQSVRFLTLPDEREAELDAAADEYDAEHEE